MDPEQSRKETAQFRFEVIAPLVVRPLAPGERTHILRDLARRLWKTADGRVIRIHQRTIARWAARYRDRGYAGLLPEVRTDSGKRRMLSDAVVARAVALRQEDPERSVRSLIRLLELEGLAAPGEVKRTTLSHALCRAGVSRAELTRARNTYRLRESPYPNAMWQLDTQQALTLPDERGRRRTLHLVACLDDYSRHVIARFYPADNRPALADLLKRAIVARGKPEVIYCDNGGPYRSEMLADACGELAIALRHSRPYRPAGRGKVERWFRTADLHFHREAQALIDHGQLTTLDQVQAFFAAWLQSEYNARVHSATHETPDDRLRHVHPEHPVVWLDPVAVARAFRWTESRVVTAVGTFSLEGNQFEVPPELARRKITVRFDPYDLAHVEVRWNGQSYGEATPLELVREHTRHLGGQSAPEPAAPAAERTPFHRLVHDHDERQRVRQAGRMHFAPEAPPAGGGEPA